MSVAVFVTNESEVQSLIPWGIQLAAADKTTLLVLCPRKSKGKLAIKTLEEPSDDSPALHRKIFEILRRQDPEQIVLRQDIDSGRETSEKDRIVVITREVVAPAPESAFVQQAEELDIRLLVLPVFEPVRGLRHEKSEWEDQLFHAAPCGVVCVRGTAPPIGAPVHLMIVSEGEQSSDDTYALETMARLSRATRGKVALLYVRPFDDVVASHVAQRHVDQLARSIQHRNLDVDKQIALADSMVDGLNLQSLGDYHLIVVGTRDEKKIRRLLSSLKRSEQDQQFPLAIVRQPVPLANRLWSKLKTRVRAVVPQIEREQRVELVDRLNDTSNFNFDFFTLVSLSTLIAALGLALNSTAVVIGAMLVAPLMAPIAAIGLALVQGNERLIRAAVYSVILGFVISLAIGIVVGLTLRLAEPNFTISAEMRSRVSPNLLDLAVALASGVAAAYAMGRPHLMSALSGVAIAAALVPPIATSGLAFAMGRWQEAGGASLLFLTNLVAIALGTAVTFWAIGISTHIDSKHPNRASRVWPRYVFLAVVVLSFILALELNMLNSFATPPESPGVPIETGK